MTGQRYRFVPGTAEEAPTARAAVSGPGGRGTTDRCRTAVMGPRAREVGGKEQRYVVVYAPTTACTGRPSASPHAARRSSVGNHFTPNHFSAAAVICSPTAPPATSAVSRRLFSSRFSVLLFHNFFYFGQFGSVVCSLDISGIGTRSARPAYQARQCYTTVLYFFTIHCRPIISTSTGQIFAPNVQGWYNYGCR